MAKKSDYSLFIIFFFNSLKKIGLFIIFRPSIFTIHYFLAHYSLFSIKKGHYSLIIIPHPDPRACGEARASDPSISSQAIYRWTTLICTSFKYSSRGSWAWVTRVHLVNILTGLNRATLGWRLIFLSQKRMEKDNFDCTLNNVQL